MDKEKTGVSMTHPVSIKYYFCVFFVEIWDASLHFLFIPYKIDIARIIKATPIMNGQKTLLDSSFGIITPFVTRTASPKLTLYLIIGSVNGSIFPYNILLFDLWYLIANLCASLFASRILSDNSLDNSLSPKITRGL